MPMDMDFDEEEGFTDEEYDAEVYEDEMEEELARPQEKVVNMSVAPGKSEIEYSPGD
jgi:E3 ubiquitin-protein ligase TRIP12